MWFLDQHTHQINEPLFWKMFLQFLFGNSLWKVENYFWELTEKCIVDNEDNDNDNEEKFFNIKS